MKFLTKIIFTLLIINFIQSQVSIGGSPKSILSNLDNNIPNIKLPAIKLESLMIEDEIEAMDKSIPFRFGTPFEVDYNLDNSGQWIDTESGRVWRLSITSEGAYSINLIYNRFILPEGAEMFVYDENMATVLGAFTSANNKDYHTFSTAPTKGAVTIIEYFEPYDVEFNGELSIGSVVHGYKDVFFNDERGYGDSGSCNNNVNCEVGADWADEIRSVAMILTSGGSRLCKSPWGETIAKQKHYDGYCMFCFMHLFPDKKVARNYKTKEKDVVDRVKEAFPDFTWVHDKKVEDGCSKRRPDLLLDLGTHIVIVEIDENKHSDYDCSCENKRLMELSQDVHHRPIVFIRFNPDKYVDEEGNTVKSCWRMNKNGVLTIAKTKQEEWKKRIDVLKDTIQYWTDNPVEKTVEIIQLFY